MAIQTRLSDRQLWLLTIPDDTEDAPWMVEPEFQFQTVHMLFSILGLHTRRQGLGWHLAASLPVIMPIVGSRTITAAPDLLMVEADARQRTSWHIPREGKPPRFVLEIVTTESADRDTQEKPGVYDTMGVEEYVLFDPLGFAGREPLFGFHRDAAGVFVPLTVDGAGAFWSAALDGVGLVMEEDTQEGTRWLRALDPTGRRLPSPTEEAAEAEQLRAEVRRLREGQSPTDE